MSRRSLKPTRAVSSSDDEFVMVPPKGTPSPAPAAAAAAAAASSAAEAPTMSLEEALRNRVKGTPEEEEAYEAALDKVDRAAWLGIALPPVAPPGHHLVAQSEPSKPPTLWTLLFKRAENKSTLQQLYFTTVLMVVIPLGLMALTFYTVFSGLSEESRLMYSGFAGVLGVNIVALGFGLFAYMDNGGEDDEAEQEAVDEAAEAEAKKAKWEAWEKAQEENESREDKERLQILREKHAEKQGRKLPPKESATAAVAAAAVEEEEEQESASVASRTRTRSRSRGRPAKKDSALAAADETVATPSRSTRSKKA